MLDEIPIRNSNSLFFFDKTQDFNDFYILKKYPDVVMLSAWDLDSSNYGDVKPLIEKLLDSGCKYFVCAGEYSELLHDFIDDVIWEKSINNGLDDSIHIMTTWHDTDTEEETAEFFLYLTDVRDSYLVAFLEEGRSEDDRLKNALLSLV